MDKYISIKTPLSHLDVANLKTGDMLHITGYIYTGRDAAHKKLVESLDKNEEMPFDFEGNIIFYAGPCPNRPEHAIGSVGPTTSGRMDAYTPRLIEQGLKIMIGKGLRSKDVKDSIVKNTGAYLIAVGGAAALMSKAVKEVEIIAYEELGPEAIRKLYVEDFPVIVAIDKDGIDIYD